MTGVILAGGKGVRMGGNKPSVALAGKPLLQWTVDALQQAVSSIVLAVSPGQELPKVRSRARLTVCEDLLPARGPLTGIFTGLRCSGADHVLVVPCDAPLLRPELLRVLMQHRQRFDAVIPEVGGRPETAVGVYAATCMPALVAALNGRDLSVRALLAGLSVDYVREPELRAADPDLRSFRNVNTPADLDEVEAIIEAARAAC